MQDSEIYEILSTVFERRISDKEDDVRLEDLKWDSLAELTLIANLDNLDSSLSEENLENAKTIGDLVNLLKNL